MSARPDRLEPSRLPILFVCGLHRSGTSAFTRMLGTSPGVRRLTGTRVPEDEGQHLQNVYLSAARHGGPGLFAFDPGAHLTERSGPATVDNARALINAWAPYWHLRAADRLHWGAGGVVVLEKSPPNLVRTRLLQALFPQARFAVLVRHPAAVTVSTAAWQPFLSPGTLLRHWLRAHDLFRRDLPHLSWARTLRYEDLLEDPARTVRGLAADLDFEGTIEVADVDAGHNDRRLQGWRTMSARLVGSERNTIERAIRRYGYSLDEPYVLSRSDADFPQ